MQRMYAAIVADDLETIRALIAADPELLHAVGAGETWLHSAAAHGKLEIVAMLVEAGIDINAGEERDPATALGRAAINGHLEVARWLIDHGADVQIRGHGTPLVSAVIKGDLPMVELLVEAGAELDATVGKDEPRSALAWADFYGNDEVAAYLRQRGATAIGPAGAAEEEEEEEEDEIVAHLEAHLGEVAPLSLRRIVEGDLPLAIHVVRGEDRTTLVTSGMSSRPMTVPEGEEEYQYAELMIHLPKRWPLSKKALAKDQSYWPIEWLLRIAQFPHDNDTWLGGSHTIIANGEPPEPLGPGVDFTCMLLLAQESELGQLETRDGRTIVFYTLFPLYTEERDFERESGTAELLQRFEQHGIADVVAVGRDNVAA
jgi:hypothetical protein